MIRGLAGAEPVIGVDGCGIPVHGLPLRALATMYARCATTEDPFLRRAIDGMRAEPYLVGGRDRDDTSIMQAAPDLAVKEGAEALNCAVSRTAGIGVAVKIADGGYRAVGPATVAVLDELGFLPAAARRRLRPPKGVEPIAHLSTRRS